MAIMVATIIEPRNRVSPPPIQNLRPAMLLENRRPPPRMGLGFQRHKWLKVEIHRVTVSGSKHR